MWCLVGPSVVSVIIAIAVIVVIIVAIGIVVIAVIIVIIVMIDIIVNSSICKQNENLRSQSRSKNTKIKKYFSILCHED